MLKNTLGLIAISLTFVGYMPYLKDIVKGKTKPHMYSWFLWGFVTLIVYALQSSHKAGLGGVVTLIAALMCFVVLALGQKYGTVTKATKSDKFFALLAIFSLGIWLLAKQPIISVILLTLIDSLAFVPTVRKSLFDPFSETISFYWINTVRFILAFTALSDYNLITVLYPLVWCVINGVFAIFLHIRRQQLSK